MERGALTSPESRAFILGDFGRRAGAADEKPPMKELKVGRTGITASSSPFAAADCALADT